ncbi:MAG: MBL fold metallo-hydrolase [Planctomycetota bacterium]|nr:MBL fold metallo-hydrolase [Planctomycetota bacterium]MDI6788740.1 MBL fold metallo-hydrolase [Planctomycetota bacterium]
MKIKWFGHSAFAITSESGKTLVSDPYEPGAYNGAVGYPPITIKPDIVTISHSHADHNYTKTLSGSPKIITRTGSYEVAGIKITGIPVYHDTKQGRERGDNIIFVYEIDGLRIAHLGDLGHTLSKSQLDALGKIDILLLPVGGYFTIDAAQSTQIWENIKPQITIPMHYKTEVLDLPIANVDEFLTGKKGVKDLTSAGGSEVSITRDTLPSDIEIWVLPYIRS